MKTTDIFQTLEHKNNNAYIEAHGPFWCSLYDENNNRKRDIKEPWLGEGYYFWDTRIEDARWWGKASYKNDGKGYVVCKSAYDAHSEDLFDMLGDLSAMEDFIECAKLIMQKFNLPKITFIATLEFLKNNGDFNYRAVRVMPGFRAFNKTGVHFPDDKTWLWAFTKVQICFFDNSMFIEPFRIVEEYPTAQNVTI